MKKYQTFTEFLQDKHAKNYRGLDDEMPDDFNSWLDDLDLNDVIDWADIHAENGNYEFNNCRYVEQSANSKGQRRKKKCGFGHEMIESNLYYTYRVDKKNKKTYKERNCLECRKRRDRIQHKRRYWKNKALAGLGRLRGGVNLMWRSKNKLSKKEFSIKCLCGHAKSSHGCSGCHYCDSCEFYESQNPNLSINLDTLKREGAHGEWACGKGIKDFFDKTAKKGSQRRSAR